MRLDYDVDGQGSAAQILALLEAEAWTREEITAVFRAVPGPGELAAIAVAGTVIWTPPAAAGVVLVRGVVAVADPADPLVAAGGATTVAIGMEHTTDQATLWMAAQSFAVWNTAAGRVLGWGGSGPSGASNGSTAFQGDVAMFAANAMGSAHAARALAAFTDAGTGTGTIRVQFQWRSL